MDLFSMKKEREAALQTAESMVSAAERQSRDLTVEETRVFESNMATVSRLTPQIAAREKMSTIRQFVTDGKLIPGNENTNGAVVTKPQPKTLSAEYVSDFFQHIVSGGRKTSAALYEGNNPAGGYAVPSVVDQQIVPLAPQEMSIRQLATVLPTSMDVKMPIKATKGTAAAKAEGTGSGSNVFGGTAQRSHRRLSRLSWPGTFWTCLGKVCRTSHSSRHSQPMTSSMRSWNTKSQIHPR